MWITAMVFFFLSEAWVVLRLINRNGKVSALYVILLLVVPALVGWIKARRAKGKLAPSDAAQAGQPARRLAVQALATYLATFFGLLVLIVLSGNDVISDDLFNMLAAILMTIICVVSLVMMARVPG